MISRRLIDPLIRNEMPKYQITLPRAPQCCAATTAMTRTAEMGQRRSSRDLPGTPKRAAWILAVECQIFSVIRDRLSQSCPPKANELR